MTHTPGPWYVNGDCIEADGPDGPRDLTVAMVVPFHQKERKANARLIAAATEMLKQLRAVRDDIGALALDTNGWREWDATAVDELLGSRLVRLDDLIAKAEGRE
jgi:hypothetical protein